MKSIVNNTDITIKQKPFPKLMIQHSTGTIILATASEGQYLTGMQVSTIPSEDFNRVAYYGINWYAAQFVDFEGSVTLSND